MEPSINDGEGGQIRCPSPLDSNPTHGLARRDRANRPPCGGEEASDDDCYIVDVIGPRIVPDCYVVEKWSMPVVSDVNRKARQAVNGKHGIRRPVGHSDIGSLDLDWSPARKQNGRRQLKNEGGGCVVCHEPAAVRHMAGSSTAKRTKREFAESEKEDIDLAILDQMGQKFAASEKEDIDVAILDQMGQKFAASEEEDIDLAILDQMGPMAKYPKRIYGITPKAQWEKAAKLALRKAQEGFVFGLPEWLEPFSIFALTNDDDYLLQIISKLVEPSDNPLLFMLEMCLPYVGFKYGWNWNDKSYVMRIFMKLGQLRGNGRAAFKRLSGAMEARVHLDAMCQIKYAACYNIVRPLWVDAPSKPNEDFNARSRETYIQMAELWLYGCAISNGWQDSDFVGQRGFPLPKTCFTAHRLRKMSLWPGQI